MKFLVLLGLIRLAFSTPCLPIDGDRITAADVARQFSAFSRLDPKLVIGFTPLPGTRRTFSRGQLIAIARGNGVDLEADAKDGEVTAKDDVCVERALTPLTPARICDAMLDSLGLSGARIDVLDFLRQPVPSGALDFPRSGLMVPPAARPGAPLLWRGTVRYSPQHTFAVWAKVQVTQELRVVIASREIRRGASLAVADVEAVKREVFPFAEHFESPADVLGRIARKNIPAGAVISGNLADIPPAVARGDTVHVIVSQGATRISFDALAQSSGRIGQRIVLLNPQSLRSFHAVIDAPGRAHIGEGS